jgi:hypothetical protein
MFEGQERVELVEARRVGRGYMGATDAVHVEGVRLAGDDQVLLLDGRPVGYVAPSGRRWSGASLDEALGARAEGRTPAECAEALLRRILARASR